MIELDTHTGHWTYWCDDDAHAFRLRAEGTAVHHPAIEGGWLTPPSPPFIDVTITHSACPHITEDLIRAEIEATLSSQEL